MQNDFAKPKASSKSSEYDISLCIHNYALCINEWYELLKKTSIVAEQLPMALEYRFDRLKRLFY